MSLYVTYKDNVKEKQLHSEIQQFSASNALYQWWANSGPRAKWGPPQRFQWPAEAFAKIFKSKYSPTLHSKR